MCLYTNSLSFSLILTKLSYKNAQQANLRKFVLKTIILCNKTKKKKEKNPGPCTLSQCIVKSTHSSQQDLFSYLFSYIITSTLNTELVLRRFCFGCKPVQDILLVLCDPLHVGHGPLNGLIQCQGPRAETDDSVVCLELPQLLQQTKHKTFRVVQPFKPQITQGGSKSISFPKNITFPKFSS